MFTQQQVRLLLKLPMGFLSNNLGLCKSNRLIKFKTRSWQKRVVVNSTHAIGS
jgi:hypothetical protein